jgi:putative transposon-encoded protein
MSIIQLEISDELAEKLAPYRNRLAELLELGLQKWSEREQQELLVSQKQLLQALAATGKVEIPKPYTGQKSYVRHTPVPITGKPVSELIIEQRGSL